jgi:hypothetical protein
MNRIHSYSLTLLVTVSALAAACAETVTSRVRL